MELNDQMLEELYEWIDHIPLSRQKKRIERDFSDGYCVAEIVHHFLPQIIDMHNYTPAFNMQQKMANWGILNSKVFNRFGLNVPLNITQNICNCRPGYIEVLLHNLRYKIEEKLANIETQRTNESNNTKRGSPRRDGASGGVSAAIMNAKVGSKITNQMRIEFEEKVQENLQKDENIEVLNAKIRRLEHLLELKETRIRELTNRLDKYRPTAVIAEQVNNMRRSTNNKSVRNNNNNNKNNNNYDDGDYGNDNNNNNDNNYDDQNYDDQGYDNNNNNNGQYDDQNYDQNYDDNQQNNY